MVAYVRLVFLREYAIARLTPPGTSQGVQLAIGLRFRMATMGQVAGVVRSDPALSSDPVMMSFLDNVVATIGGMAVERPRLAGEGSRPSAR